MPNWCYTKLSIRSPAESVSALKAECFTDGWLDFDKVVPMSPELAIEDGSTGYIGYQVLAGDWRKIAGYPWVARHGPFESRKALIRHFERLDADRKDEREQYLALGRRYLENRKRFGYTTWYSWRIDHWGTKWNVSLESFPVRLDEPGALGAYFETAWSPALPILAELSRRYPRLAFEMAYADEGGGFAGVAAASAGEVSDREKSWEVVMIDELGFPPEDEE